MALTITAYTDFRSPYTYVAKAEVYRWQADFGVDVDWWPYTTPLQEVFGPANGRNEREFRKIKYMYMNVRRVGAEQGLTIRGTKRIFDPTAAHIGLLQAKDDGVLRPFHDDVFEVTGHSEAVIVRPMPSLISWGRERTGSSTPWVSDRSPGLLDVH